MYHLTSCHIGDIYLNLYLKHGRGYWYTVCVPTRAGITILHKNSIFVCALGVLKLIFVGDVKYIFDCKTTFLIFACQGSENQIFACRTIEFYF